MNKITEQDLANRGVKGLPDVPGLTTEEMQRKLEEIAREILIPKVNELVEGLNNANSNLKHGVCELIGFTTERLKKTIYFDTPFETTPNVVISPKYVEYEGGDSLFKYIALDSITTTSFTIVYKGNSISDSWPWSVNWIAMA